MGKIIDGLADLMGGAVEERFNNALNEVTENMYDPNRVASAARKVTIEIILVPNEDRSEADMQFKVKTTLAPLKTMKQSVWLAKDNDGNVVAVEQTREIPGQMTLGGDEVTQKRAALGKLEG
jgi:hypothetical protein